MTPYPGFLFHHARVLDADNSPQLYRVTRIARGAVYYRPVYDDGVLGGVDYCPLEQFPQWSIIKDR